MERSDSYFNPFPGLRPFEMHENYLFFGRDGQSDALLRRLRRNHFLAVVGTSGSGKSSLVRAGLLPDLHSGFMAGSGSHWRIAIFRPGDNPIGNMAEALCQRGVLADEESNEDDIALQASFIHITLERGAFGLIEAVRQANLPKGDNLLIVVDQFEELFRFRASAQVQGAHDQAEGAHDQAAAFVKLLLQSVRQDELPIYVTLTMRSDFIGDCAQFRDLPEAVNDSQYLIPRMTRDQCREAICGPVAVGGAGISERLVQRLLNDVGDNPDQLPILQHALMRTWDRWQSNRKENEPIDLSDYEAIGGMGMALSQHADEAYEELAEGAAPASGLQRQQIAEKLFKFLSEKGGDNREMRRPGRLADLAAAAECKEEEAISIIETFRKPGRSFLMPPSNVALASDSLIDISHESLIRIWQRLKSWVDEEAESARIYRRLAETSALYKRREAGLWRDPDLRIALQWRERDKPNETWAKRYDPGFLDAMAFLHRSERSELTRRRGRWIALWLVVATFVGTPAYIMYRSYEKARQTAEALQVRLDDEKELAAKAEERAKAVQAVTDTALGQLARKVEAKAAQGDGNKQQLQKAIESVKKDIRQEVENRVATIENPADENPGEKVAVKDETGKAVSSTRILPPEDKNFLACESMSNLEPYQCQDTFSPGRVYIFASVITPAAEKTLTLKWSDGTAKLIGSKQIVVRASQDKGFRTYAWRNFQAGSYKACLFDHDVEIQCRRFTVR